MKITVINGTEKHGVTYNLKETFLKPFRGKADITEFYLPKDGPGFGSFLDVTAAGFFAAVCDSALGSGVQVKYRCAVCGTLTEKPRHCGVPGTAERGVRWMTNDAVNLCNNLLGALAALGFAARFRKPCRTADWLAGIDDTEQQEGPKS